MEQTRNVTNFKSFLQEREREKEEGGRRVLKTNLATWGTGERGRERQREAERESEMNSGDKSSRS